MKLTPNVKSIEIKSGILKLSHICLGKNRLSENAQKDFLSFCNKPQGEENIFFEDVQGLENEEYEICVTQEKITVKSSSVSGELYALQTLKQIFFQTDYNVPCLTIKDKPEFKIRGFMLDSGRYFFSVDDVKHFIRQMAMHKLNLFHFHLTEDQGWRIEIKKYPLLTQVGSVRKKTNFNHKPHGGFYTQEEIREIVSYAHDFCIKVMPEFDIPGHSRSAIACYNDLTCFPRKLPVADHWGVKHDVLCVGKDSTIEFVKNVLDEFFELFPDEYFHIGGDEVPKHRWNLCPHCQKRIKELGLKDSDDLQIWFMNLVKDYCKEHGKQSFMWSWDLKEEGRLDTDLGFTKCGELETGERPFIDTSVEAYYIDLPYGYISLEKSAEHKPYNGNCLGVEATLWTEYVPDMKKAQKMTYPRLSAVSETGWCGESSWKDLKGKMDFYYKFLGENKLISASLNQANPNKIRAFFSGLLFERRQLAWEGLKNVFDDKYIENIAKKDRS